MAVTLSWPFTTHYRISQGYGVSGWPGHPGASEAEIGGHTYKHWHAGIDIEAPCGTPILAPAAGEVIFAGHDPTGYGLLTEILHDDGVVTLFGHQSQQDVTVGQVLVTGQQIGLSGGGTGDPYKDGKSSGCHLHFEVRLNGGAFGADVDPATYLSNSPAVQTAPTPPSIPQAGAAGATTTDPSTDTLPPPLGADKNPVAIRTVTLAEVTGRGGFPVALLAVGGVVLAVEDLSCTLPGYRHAGSWSATVPIESGAALASGPVQVIIYLGYVPRLPWTGGLSGLAPVFTGLLDGGADLDYEGPRRQASLSGPDLSGLMSTDSAAAPELSSLLGSGTGDSFANLTATAIARALARRHNLGFQGSDSGAHAGSYYGQDTLKARTQGQTEWDVLQALAQAEGRVCYMSGTTLVFDKIPGAAQTVTLVHGRAAPGQPPISRVRIRPQAHGGRTYRVVVQSYQIQQKSSATSTVLSADAVGDNPDSTQVVTITMPPNRSKAQLDAQAQSVLAVYQATETIVDIYAEGPLAVARNQPVRLQSTEAPVPANVLYPVTLEYGYQQGEGITCHLVCTTRPWAVLDTGTESAVA